MAVEAPVSGGIGGASGGTFDLHGWRIEEASPTLKPLFEIMDKRPCIAGDARCKVRPRKSATTDAWCYNDRHLRGFALPTTGWTQKKCSNVGQHVVGVLAWSMNAYCLAPVLPHLAAENGYYAGFAAELMLKDLGLSQQAARDANADTPMGELCPCAFSLSLSRMKTATARISGHAAAL